ncbi:hypothetical protein [Candidatus Hecatella orcuttiae]|jgi:hypothetical protein|uniref:hypothetical protein n=1 Tax=Candidatus Hecatella orcuttiae TaxID=1935119 RepID=UPI002867D6CA|nr:hypothetical protein [Candidatus Hecatella orcuttiae]
MTARRFKQSPLGRSFRDVVSAALELLERSGLSYALTGGAALPYFGRARATADVDLVVEHDEEKLRRFVEELNRGGFTVPWEWVERSLEEKTHFTVQDTLSPYRLDVKVLQPGEGLGRTVEAVVDGRPMRLTAPEELVALKLRLGSDLDLEDARSIVARQGSRLDVQYLLRKAEEQGVREKAVKLLEEEGVEVGEA